MNSLYLDGVFDSDCDQYLLCETDTDRNKGMKKASGANVRVTGVLQKTVSGATSGVPITESVQVQGVTWVMLASGETVANGDPLKAINSSGHAGKAAVSTDKVFGYSRQSATGPCLISCYLDANSSYQ